MHNNDFVQLPAPVSGTVGAAVNTSALGARKTIIVGGSFTGSLTVEVSADGGTNWAPLVGASNPTVLKVTASADFMRIRVAGGAPSVWVGAFETGSLKATIPVGPVGTFGAPVDVTGFGGVKTFVSGAAFNGSVQIEASDDGIQWAPLDFFTGVASSTQSGYMKYLRSFRKGSSVAPGGPAAISVVACNDDAEAGSTALTEPAMGFVWRPYDVLGVDHDNVYVSWTNLYAALQDSKTRGPRTLFFDAANSPITDSVLGKPAVRIPDGTWDMTEVIWSGVTELGSFSPAMALLFGDACHIENLQIIDSIYELWVMNESSVNIPITIRAAGANFRISGDVHLVNNSVGFGGPVNPTAKPLITAAPGSDIYFRAFYPASLGWFDAFGFTNPFAPQTPILDMNGGFTWLIDVLWSANAIGCTGGNGFLLTNRDSQSADAFQNNQPWLFNTAGMAATTIFEGSFVRTAFYVPNTFGGFPLVTSAAYADPNRPSAYQPPPPGVATKYVAKHGEFLPCDSTPGQLDIELPSALISRGDVVIVKDATGNASMGNPIVITPRIDATGTGDAIGGVAPAMTLTDAAGLFTPAMVGHTVTIAGATTPANNGNFKITGFTSATVINYDNSIGVAEVFPGTWGAGEAIDGVVGPVSITTASGNLKLISYATGNWAII